MDRKHTDKIIKSAFLLSGSGKRGNKKSNNLKVYSKKPIDSSQTEYFSL